MVLQSIDYVDFASSNGQIHSAAAVTSAKSLYQDLNMLHNRSSPIVGVYVTTVRTEFLNLTCAAQNGGERL